jgi:uncharacterized protein (TIGR02266 family)
LAPRLHNGSPMNADRRMYPRAPLSGEVRCYVWNRPLQAEAVEISGNGMFVRTREALPEGTMLTLRLSLPGSPRTFTTLAKVVRTVHGGVLRPRGAGVHFEDLGPADRRAIIEYVGRRILRAA